VLEELDAPNEYYFDKKALKLYYYHNATAGTPPPASLRFESVERKVLIDIAGTVEKPVEGVSIEGVHVRDSALTFMDPHGMPSGGDWCLQRSGAIQMTGTVRTTIEAITVGCILRYGASKIEADGRSEIRRALHCRSKLALI
jgi:hypothetical protein